MIDRVDQVLDGKLSPPDFLDWLERYFPWLEKLRDTPQDSEWHAEGCVRIHTEMVINALLSDHDRFDELTEKEQRALVIGAALHDIGKAETTREKQINGRVRTVSPRHAEMGRSYIVPYLASFPELDLTLFDWILGIVGYHHHPLKLATRDASAGRYARIARSIPLHLLWIFERADINGRICSDADGQLEILDLFRLGAEESGCWRETPYDVWKDRILNDFDIRDDGEAEYVYDASVYLFEHDEIKTLEEGVAKTWGQRSCFGKLTLVCGPSGSGKSSWIDSQEVAIVSLDDLRVEVSGRRDRQADNGKVMQLAKERLKGHLRTKSRVIWDATSLRRDGREMLVDLAHRYGCASEIVGFAVSPAELSRRNKSRQHDVPTKVIERQLDRWQWPDVWESQRVDTVRG